MGKYFDETIFICDCNSTEHQVIFELEKEVPSDELPMLFMMIHLNKKTFLKRVTYAFRYIFGYQCRYGAFDEVIFQPEDADKLLSLANKLKEIEVKYKARRNLKLSNYE